MKSFHDMENAMTWKSPALQNLSEYKSLLWVPLVLFYICEENKIFIYIILIYGEICAI